jgi:hypothetical protein
MNKPTLKCALLGTLIAHHCWGSPSKEDSLLSMSRISNHEYPKARKTIERLRSKPYAHQRSNRGVELVTSGFGVLADVLYHECNWEPYEIKSRLKHYKGWDDHEWA